MLGLHLNRNISLEGIIHLIVIIAAIVGLALAGEQWKTTVEMQMQQVTALSQHEVQRVNELSSDFRTIDERLSRMEGKIDSIDRAVK